MNLRSDMPLVDRRQDPRAGAEIEYLRVKCATALPLAIYSSFSFGGKCR